MECSPQQSPVGTFQQKKTTKKQSVTKKCDGQTDAGQKTSCPNVSAMPEAGDKKINKHLKC